MRESLESLNQGERKNEHRNSGDMMITFRFFRNHQLMKKLSFPFNVFSPAAVGLVSERVGISLRGS